MITDPIDHHVILNGVDSHIVESGNLNGIPVVLMHGWGCQASTLASIEKAIAQNCHVYNVDFPGFGSSQEPGETWDVEDYAQWLHDLTEKFGIDRPVLLGHSFGGRVAILYASKWPTSKLILVDAAGVKPRRSLRYYVKVYSFKLAKRLAPIILGREKAEKYIEGQRSKRGSNDYAISSPRMRAIMSRVINQDLKYAMPDIHVPTLLIWGEKDTATPIGDAKIMERLIPDAGLVAFPGCGHYSFLDNPVQFAAVIRSFLSSSTDNS